MPVFCFFAAAENLPDSKPNEQFSTYPGISIKYDPAKSGKFGSCQFEAVGDQLNTPGTIVRQRAVDYLRDNADTFAGFHTNDSISWTAYLNSMKDTSTFGDHLTLQAAACAYSVNVFILDAADEGRCLAISSSIDDRAEDRNAAELLSGTVQIVLLGYYNEDKGAHYVSLTPTSEQCVRDTAMRVFARQPATTAPVTTEGTQNLEPNNYDINSKVCQVNTGVAKQQAELTNITADVANDTAQAQVSSDSASTPFGVKQNSWRDWKRSRPWLSCKDGKVFCTACQNMLGKTLVFLDVAETREDDAFTVLGVQASTSKKLLKKLDKHTKTKRHAACVKSAKIAASAPTEQAFTIQNRRFEELHADQISATEKVFRVAYLCAKQNLPFAKHAKIIACHQLNGAEMGSLLYSAVTCQEIVKHISSEMKEALISYIITSGTKFSTMIDESTSVSTKCCLVIYIRLLFEDEVTNYFFDLVEVAEKDGRSIANCIIQTLTDNGLSVDMLKKHLIGFASDGASAMIGKYSGAATLLQQILGVKCCAFHCMAHRLELAVNSVVKNITAVSHFRMLCEEFHNIYAHSTKRLVQLQSAAKELSLQIFKIGRVFDVRWLMSTYSAVDAIWRDLAPLQSHMAFLSGDGYTAAKDKAKFSGLHRKLQTWKVIAELGLMRDALRELSRFSLHLQHRDTTVLTVGDHLEVLLRALAAMQEICGSSLKVVVDALPESDHSDESESQLLPLVGMEAAVKNPSRKEVTDFGSFRKQFLQGLVDNIKERFPDKLLKTVQVLDCTTWPEDDINRALYGDIEVMELATTVNLEVT